MNRALTLVVFLFFLGVAAPAVAQPMVFLVRHAERADTAAGGQPKMGADPELSAAGRQRAESLATVLKDANITAVYATEFKRTQQTAAPIAKALGLTVTVIPSDNTADLLKRLKSSKGNVLVVGHSDSVPEIIKSLGVKAHVKIGDDDFDNLFVVTLGGTPSMVRLHYR